MLFCLVLFSVLFFTLFWVCFLFFCCFFFIERRKFTKLFLKQYVQLYSLFWYDKYLGRVVHNKIVFRILFKTYIRKKMEKSDLLPIGTRWKLIMYYTREQQGIIKWTIFLTNVLFPFLLHWTFLLQRGRWIYIEMPLKTEIYMFTW